MGFHSAGPQIIIRDLRDEDYDKYHDIFYSHSQFKKVFDLLLMDKLWTAANSEDMLVCTIIDKASGEICGFCQLDRVRISAPEIGINIADAYMGKGYAQEAVKLMLEYVVRNLGINQFIWKADADNAVSRHIVEKLGGVLISETTLLSQDVLERGQEKGWIDPEDISRICRYLIAVPD